VLSTFFRFLGFFCDPQSAPRQINQTRPGAYTAEQQKAISGFSQVGNIVFLSRSGGRQRRRALRPCRTTSSNAS